jgi:hypothetical protein
MAGSAYEPFTPARRPGGKPEDAPVYRVLVHRRYADMYKRLPEAIGLQQAQQLWDHLATSPYEKCAVASTTILRGRIGKPRGVGWSRTVHYEASSMARVNYQYHNNYVTTDGDDPHHVVAILTINLASH